MMLRTLVVAGAVLLLASPVLADSYAPPPGAGQQATKQKPANNSSSYDGRTLADYNIQKE